MENIYYICTKCISKCEECTCGVCKRGRLYLTTKVLCTSICIECCKFEKAVMICRASYDKRKDLLHNLREKHTLPL